MRFFTDFLTPFSTFLYDVVHFAYFDKLYLL